MNLDLVPVSGPAGPFEQLIQIPGPKPILREGAEEAWDGQKLEACNALKDGDTYSLLDGSNPEK